MADVLAGLSDKIVVIVGPCSIHNPAEAREYAELLRKEAEGLPELVVIMRAYFEKVSRLISWGKRRRLEEEDVNVWFANSPEQQSDGKD